MTCLWDTTYVCWVFLSWLHFLTGFLHFCARSVGFGPAKQTTCSWQQALHPYITCPWFRPNSDSLRITHSLLQDPEQASSHRTSIRRKRLRWNWSWMIQLKRKHNGLGVKWMQPSLAPSLEIGYAEPAANSNLKQYREENCMHSSLLFLYTNASSSTFITCTTWVTQPYLNPSAHGPTWSSERLTAINYMCDHCLSQTFHAAYETQAKSLQPDGKYANPNLNMQSGVSNAAQISSPMSNQNAKSPASRQKSRC
jgi:hypothetical protein